MFDLPFSYEYTLLGTPNGEDGPFKKCHLYKFRNKSKRIYHVRVEHYDHDLHIIKFYAARMEQSPKKYQIMHNDYDASRILTTCLRIAIEIYKKNNLASFAFHGQRNPDEKICNTKRYRVYKHITASRFDMKKFNHIWNDEFSYYGIINKANNTPNLENVLEEMLRNYYNFDEYFTIPNGH